MYKNPEPIAFIFYIMILFSTVFNYFEPHKGGEGGNNSHHFSQQSIEPYNSLLHLCRAQHLPKGSTYFGTLFVEKIPKLLPHPYTAPQLTWD
jgi:hypothetical protein